ncbi:MAG: ribosomal protein S18-alanine N-acetyltransferase [bacterium]
MTRVTKTFEISLRAMVAGDLATIAALEAEIFSDNWSEQSFQEILSDPSWQAIVAEADNTIIGFACWVINEAESHLANIAVAPEHRRKSVAKRLLERILDSVTGSGCDCLLLEVRPSNPAAIAFYERHGFEHLYRQPNYYHRPVEDALVMVHYLL